MYQPYMPNFIQRNVSAYSPQNATSIHVFRLSFSFKCPGRVRRSCPPHFPVEGVDLHLRVEVHDEFQPSNLFCFQAMLRNCGKAICCAVCGLTRSVENEVEEQLQDSAVDKVHRFEDKLVHKIDLGYS